MKRLARLIALASLALITACSSDVDNSEPPASLTDIESPLAVALNWKLDTRGDGNAGAYRLRPLITDERVYTIDTGGNINAVDIAGGRQLWRYETGLTPITGLGGDARLLLVASRDGEVAAYGKLENGLEPRWKVALGSEIRAPAVLDREQVFIRSVDGKLRALNAADGSQQWVLSHRVPALSLTGNSMPLVDGELVFAGFDDGKLVAVNRHDGQIAWQTTIGLSSGRTEVERLVDLDGSFVLRDGVIYVASFQGRLAAVQALSGDLLWSRDFSSFQAIAVDRNALYLSSDKSHLWAIDRRTGSSFWKQDVLNARKITAPSVVDDKLVVADLDGYLHWFNKTDGKLRARIRTSDASHYVQPLAWQQSVLTFDKHGLLSSISMQQ